MSVSLTLSLVSVCLSVREYVSENYNRYFANFCALLMAVARFSSGSFAVCDVMYRAYF